MISKVIQFERSLEKFEKSFGFQTKLKWRNIILIFAHHLLAIYWCYNYAFPCKWQTLAFALLMASFSAVGITCGVHRLWTHKSYKATRPLSLFLVFCYICVGQNPIYNWVRDHRIHHKYSDTDADPHNIKRGFFFSHIGWLMMKTKKEVVEKGRQVDMSDIEADPVLMFERRCCPYLGIMFCHVLPTLTGIYLLGENWKCVVAWQNFIRPLLALHSQWSVNSFAHTFGWKPYNKKIYPSENLFVSIMTYGEGWHNYHHSFPNDYKGAELYIFNISTHFISLCAKLGLAYDLKEASPELVKAVSMKNSEKMKLIDENNLKLIDDETMKLIDKNNLKLLDENNLKLVDEKLLKETDVQFSPCELKKRVCIS